VPRLRLVKIPQRIDHLSVRNNRHLQLWQKPARISAFNLEIVEVNSYKYSSKIGIANMSLVADTYGHLNLKMKFDEES
jgi:hypothetical protein